MQWWPPDGLVLTMLRLSCTIQTSGLKVVFHGQALYDAHSTTLHRPYIDWNSWLTLCLKLFSPWQSVKSTACCSSQDETSELYFWHHFCNCIIYHQPQDEPSSILLEGNSHCCWKHPTFLQYVKSTAPISFQQNGWKLILRLLVNNTIEDKMSKPEHWSLILGWATGCWLDWLSWLPFLWLSPTGVYPTEMPMHTIYSMSM